ncbi:MAG: hypothetical protein KBD48_03700 [Candidatus Pacebacteria bacterium]|nr:hypothetical protein [Candidatus Paceibacterota bacterium]MBP9716260.1 hypothetical protein [Candidatus Paceibacterota bacterium]
MSFEIPKTNINPEVKTTADFEGAAIEFALKQKQQALDDVNKRYPEAKIPIHLVEGDEINGYKVKGESLEEYAKSQDLIYGKPQGKIEEKEDNLYHRN